MRGFRTTFLFGAIIGWGYEPLLADTIVLSDFHGTIVESSRERLGAFQARFKLFRVDFRANTLQAPATGPAEVWVTQAELKEMEMYLAKGNNRPGSLNRRFKLEDGREIIPGEYYVTLDSFGDFLDSTDGQNPLIRQWLEAESRKKQIEKHITHEKGSRSKVVSHIQGRAFEVMQYRLSTPELAQSFGILTASGYSREVWMEFFRFLHKKRLIKNLPNEDYIFSVAQRDFDIYDLAGNSASQKIQVLEEVIRQLRRVPLKESDNQTNLDADGDARLHTVMVLEDHAGVMELIWARLRALVQGRIVPVKIVLVHAGDDEIVAASGRPRVVVIRGDGTWREPTETEWTEWFPAKSGLRDCGSLVARMASQGVSM